VLTYVSAVLNSDKGVSGQVALMYSMNSRFIRSIRAIVAKPALNLQESSPSRLLSSCRHGYHSDFLANGSRTLIDAQLRLVNDEQGRTAESFDGELFVQRAKRPVATQ
jgi:hypothetical protein